jgi:type II secretory pathway predicted ATPase ExeA/cell division septation protein DedD
VLTGEVGTGKTTLCRAVLQSLDRKTFAAFVPDPFLSREDLLKTLLVGFGVVSVDDIRGGRLRRASRTDLSYPLYEFLTSLQPLQAFAVVVIDEAQNLSTQLLEEIRILSELEKRQKLLEVLLVGQPELQSRLSTSGMRQLSQRVTTRCELAPFARTDVKPYVSHRLTIAGDNGTLQFTDAAIDLVCAASSGIPRVINLVCDRALLRAARSRTMTVDVEHIVWAVDDLRLPVARTVGAQFRDRPVSPSKSLRQESPEVSAGREQRQDQRQPQDEGSLPTAAPIASTAGGLTRPTPGSASQTGETREGTVPETAASALAFKEDLRYTLEAIEEIRHDPVGAISDHPLPAHANVWLEQILVVPQRIATRPSSSSASQTGETREGSVPETLASELAVKEDFASTRRRQSRLLALVSAVLAVTTAVVGCWYLVLPVSPRQSDVLAQPSPSLVPSDASPVGPVASVNLSPAPVPSLNPRLNQTDATPSAPGASANIASPTRAHERARSESSVPGQRGATKFVLQMATFQSAARAGRALQEFRDAGYHAYIVEISLRDGGRAIAVFLGPYAEFARAERDLAGAQRIPGYSSARIVQVGPSAPTP